MENTLTFLLYYGYFGFALCLMTISGAVIRRLTGFRSTFLPTQPGLFLDFLLGLVAVSTVYAIVKTNFVTIQVLFLVVGGLLCVAGERPKVGKSDEMSKSATVWALLAAFLGSLLVFAFFYFAYFGGNAQPGQWGRGLVTFNGDHITHANFSYFIAQTGQENEFHILNLLDPAYRGVTPYHYLELWLNAGLADLLGLPHVYCLGLVTFPSIFMLCWLGLLALGHQVGLHPMVGLLASVVALGFGGIMVDSFQQVSFLQNLETYAQSIFFTFPKLWVIYGWVMLLVLLGLQGNFASAMVSGLGLAVATPIGAPAVGVAVAAVIGLQFWRAWLPRRAIWWSLLGLVAVLGGHLLFYRWFGNDSLAREGTSVSGLATLLAELANPETLRTRRNIFVGGIFHLTVLYLPYFLALALGVGWYNFKVIMARFKREAGTVIILPLGLGLGGLIGWAIFYKS
jgi:hypothetical protein